MKEVDGVGCRGGLLTGEDEDVAVGCWACGLEKVVCRWPIVESLGCV